MKIQGLEVDTDNPLVQKAMLTASGASLKSPEAVRELADILNLFNERQRDQIIAIRNGMSN